MIPSLLRRPFLLWAVYLVAVTLVALVFKALFPDLRAGAAGLSFTQLGGQVVLTLLPLPFVLALGWRALGFTAPVNLRLLAYPSASVAFGFLVGFQDVGASHVLLAVALVLLVALGEEAAFRGVFLHALRPRGVWYAVLVSSAMFGLMHLPNLAMGAPPVSVALQVLFAGLGGVGFAALRLRTNSLWPGIAIHASYDLAFRVADIQPGSTHSNMYYMLHGVGFLALALVLLRPSVRAKLTTPVAV